MTNEERTIYPRICEVLDFGPDATSDASDPIDLLLEVPHGADRAVDYDELAAELQGPFPDDLRDFFFVNTDVGAAAVAQAAAEEFVAAEPGRRAVVLLCRIPRTFVDCNRVLEPPKELPGDLRLTPGLPPWITNPQDHELLVQRYGEYQQILMDLYARSCGTGGRALMVHSYAPRSLDVPVDDAIVERLRAEYEPERITNWPLRPAVDLIAEDPEGVLLGSPEMTTAARTALEELGHDVVVSGCYSLLPGTVAEQLARRYVGRTLCLEFRRDLLVEEFTPFAEMTADPQRVAPLARALAAAARA